MLLPGCSARRDLRPGYSFPEGEPAAFSFVAEQTVRTDLEQLPPEAAAFDLGPIRGALADRSVAVEGTISRVRLRRFSDGTRGIVIRVDDLSSMDDDMDVDMDVDGAQDPAVSTANAIDSLKGRSVSVRTRSTGEWLSADGWEHITEIAGLGPALIPALQATVWRLPASTEFEPREFRFHLPVEPMAGSMRDELWSGQVQRGEDVPCVSDGSATCATFVYRARLQLRYQQDVPGFPVRGEGEGAAEVSLCFDPAAGEIDSMSWEVTRQRLLETFGPDGEVRAGVRQESESSGRLEWQR